MRVSFYVLLLIDLINYFYFYFQVEVFLIISKDILVTFLFLDLLISCPINSNFVSYANFTSFVIFVHVNLYQLNDFNDYLKFDFIGKFYHFLSHVILFIFFQTYTLFALGHFMIHFIFCLNGLLQFHKAFCFDFHQKFIFYYSIDQLKKQVCERFCEQLVNFSWIFTSKHFFI